MISSKFPRSSNRKFLLLPSRFKADFLDCSSTVSRLRLDFDVQNYAHFSRLRSRFNVISRSSLGVRFSQFVLTSFLSASSRLRCKSSPLRHRFNYISPCVIVSKIRPQPLKTPREQPSTFSDVKLPSKDKPALKRRTGRERASKILHFPFWDFYIFRGQQSVFAAFIRNSPHPWGG